MMNLLNKPMYPIRHQVRPYLDEKLKVFWFMCGAGFMSAMMDSMEQHKFNPLSKHAVPEN